MATLNDVHQLSHLYGTWNKNYAIPNTSTGLYGHTLRKPVIADGDKQTVAVELVNIMPIDIVNVHAYHPPTTQ